MRDYKIFLTGSDRHATFFCERCAVGDGIEVIHSRGRVVRRERASQPGMCPGCRGSKRDERDRSKKCYECGGSGVCPECNGAYARTWNELPVTAQAKILSRLEHGEELLAGYESTSGLLREF